MIVTALTALTLVGAGVPLTASSSSAAVSGDQSSTPDSSVSITRTVRRTHLIGGDDVEADKRTVTLNVSRTQDLRSRQPVEVTWSGAHPTGNATADTTSPSGVNDEFPFVLMQCRGVDSPSVPVSQRITPQTCWTQTGPQERFTQTRSTEFPAWRVDRYATGAERTVHVNDPSPLPAGCDTATGIATRRVPFTSVQGTTYYPDGGSCTKLAPENLVVDNSAQPGNTTYGITRPTGSGDTRFTVWTTQDNASLGCSITVACSLVAIPVMGVSCDVAASALPVEDRPSIGEAAAVSKDCMSQGNYGPGENNNGAPPALGVSGRLWWSESNWRNRITVPLSFALADNVCDIVGSKDSTDLYGSELMTQAMIQWRPAFCLDAARTPFRHVQVGEPQAANLVSQGSVEAALVSDPPRFGFSRKVANTPVAVSGFAISYSIDDETGARYSSLKLNARLIAKLLTMSYPGTNFVQNEFAALQSNPLDMSRDPEFQALNPGIKKGVASSISASTILSLSSDSDVMTALSSYLQADPEARAWFNGSPDPWGMRINPSYQGMSLPVQSWPQRDTFEPKEYYATGLNPCLQNSPVPFLPLIASPTIRLSNISLAMQFASSTSQTTCAEATPGSTVGLKLVSGGRQSPGFRFVLGVTSIADARRYALDTAALQTQVSAEAAKGKFVDGSGRIFVAPDESGLRAAARLLVAQESTNTWKLPVERILTENAANDAYPGTMVVYAAVPTRGLPAADAAAYADLLSWMTSTGQQPGTTNGTLPAGYLPLTADNGLGALVTYAGLTVTAVADQKGAVPSVLMRQAAPLTSPVTATPTAPVRATTPTAPAVPTSAPTPGFTASPLVAPPPVSVALPVAPRPQQSNPGQPAPAAADPVPAPRPSTASPTPQPSTSPAGVSGPSSSVSSSTTGSAPGSGPLAGSSPTMPFKPRLVAATPTKKVDVAAAPVAGVGAVAQRLSTLATEMGLAGNVPALLILCALLSGGAVAVTMLNRQLRGRRG